MGLRITLENEYGDPLHALDETRLLNSFLPDLDDESFSLLGYIDPDGETRFSSAQAQVLLGDLKVLQQRVEYEDVVSLIEEIMGLIRQLADQPSHSLLFSGK